MSRVQGKKMVTASVSTAGEQQSRSLTWANLALGVMMVGSAFAVIQSTHACRELYKQLQVLESHQWLLQEDYGRLLLEESTWASNYRIEKVARKDLGMTDPDLMRYKVLQQ